MPESLPIAKGNRVHALLPRMANRHGLIAGATGTGKTVTLRTIAENSAPSAYPCSWPTSKAICRELPHPASKILRY